MLTKEQEKAIKKALNKIYKEKRFNTQTTELIIEAIKVYDDIKDLKKVKDTAMTVQEEYINSLLNGMKSSEIIIQVNHAFGTNKPADRITLKKGEKLDTLIRNYYHNKWLKSKEGKNELG